jgi:3'(2'), 5'-bisphosphate nucleotidase
VTALANELQVATRLALEAGEIIRKLHASGISVDKKAGNEPVTQADRDANAHIVAGLTAEFPDDGLLTEEAPDDGSRLKRPRVWMVDPLDGTKDFIRGESGFAVMIGLCVDERPALGVVYQPIGDRLYFASRGAGAFTVVGHGTPNSTLTTDRMHVSKISEPSQIRMVASKSHRDEKIDQVRAALGITDELNVGSVGLKLGLIARGERELYVNPSGHSKLWDVCAPEAILVEAGGKLTDAHGKPIDYRGKDVRCLNGLIASNGKLHDTVVERLAALFPTR